MTKKDRGPESKLHSLSISTDQWSRLRKGNVAESAVLLRLAILGLPTYISPFDGDGVDAVVLVGDTFKKVAVRWAGKGTHGLPTVSLRKSDGRNAQKRFDRSDFDFIVGYDLYSDTAYVWSHEEIAHLRGAVTISA